MKIIHQGGTHLILAAATLGLAATLSAYEPPIEQAKLVNYCVAFSDNAEPRYARFAPYAAAKLRSMPRAQLKIELQELQKNTQNSSHQGAIAYTLAYFGVDVLQNVQKMPQMDASLPAKLYTLYHRHPSPQLLRYIFSVHVNCEIASGIEPIWRQLFRETPRTVLRACAARPYGLKRLRNILFDQVSRSENLRHRKLLSNIANGPDKNLARAAKFCLK